MRNRPPNRSPRRLAFSSLGIVLSGLLFYAGVIDRIDATAVFTLIVMVLLIGMVGFGVGLGAWRAAAPSERIWPLLSMIAALAYLGLMVVLGLNAL